ncbi:MAG TPA: thiol reductant ABC exporter subunit CydD [Candidatus Nanopelagicales bacterium]|nr:thiol reductant ABC exporter subunit CydD [Candidatus Nanopelagicales bacterium]
MRTDRRLLASGRPAAVALGAAVVLGALSAGLAVAQAALLARSISGAFLGGEGLPELGPSLVALAAVLAARAFLSWGAEIVAQRISGVVKSDLRRRLLARAVALGPRWASEARSGEVVLLATRGLDALDGYFARYLPQLALAAIVPLVVVVCLATADLVAALTVALTVPLIPVFMVLVGRMSEARRRRRWSALARLAHRFLDVVAGLPTLRAYGRADAQVAILRRVTDAYRAETMGTLRIAFLSALVLELLATISVALVAVGIGLRLATGGMTLEVGLFALVLAPEAYLPLRRLGAEFHASEEGLTAAAKAFEIIDAPPPAGGTRTAMPCLRGGRLVIDGVSVVQPGRAVAAPAGLSLDVRPGEVVALTGPSGAGKSTLLAAVLGLVEPSAGRIAVEQADGTVIDVRDLDGDRWRAGVAWVPQEPFLVPGSVADNIRLVAPDASDDAIAAGLAEVGLGDLDPGRVLGERGAGLSSGQRRRIGVARALLRGSPLLLLDEPTAGLDAVAEAAVLAAVARAARDGAAVLLVAHRPAAAALADRAVTVAWAALTQGAA